MGPSIICLIVFVILPIVMAFYYSLTNYDLMQSPVFAGVKNYQNILADNRYPHAVTNTLYFAFGTVPTGIVTSLLLAVLINRQIRGIYAYRALFYMPVVSSFVSVSLIWLWMYEPNFGLFNEGLEALGLPRSKWLRSAQTAMLAIIIMSVWKNMGLNMVIYLAGLQGVPTTFFVVIVYFIGALQMFVQVYVMTQGGRPGEWGGPRDSTIPVVVLMYANAFEYLKMGYAAAIACALFVVIGIVTLINARLLSYDVGY